MWLLLFPHTGHILSFVTILPSLEMVHALSGCTNDLLTEADLGLQLGTIRMEIMPYNLFFFILIDKLA